MRVIHGLAILSLCAATQCVSADILTVSSGESIQAAINSSANGDQILVYPGVYTERIDYLGKAIEIVSVAGPAATTLDVSAIGGSAVTFADWEAETSILDGFRITGGTGTMVGSVSMGGGIYIDLAGPKIRNCVIEDNTAGAGAGIAIRTGWPIVSNCDIRHNDATDNSTGYGGGGIFAGYRPSIYNCTITGNTALLGHGGGIALSGGDAIVANCLITNNAAYYGGGLRNAGTDALISNCTFYGNSAVSAGGAIMGLYTTSMTTLTNSILTENFAGYDTETYSMSGAFFAITNSCVRGMAGNPSTGMIAESMPFVDASNNDFRLRSDSNAVNAGADDMLPEDLADLDGDLNLTEALPLDLAIYGESGDNIRVVGSAVDLGAFELQTVPDEGPQCESDTNNDTFVNVFDLIELLEAWGPCTASCAGDTDANNAIDVFDLIALLDAWGACP